MDLTMSTVSAIGHIQAVYVQNSLKLFCFIAEKMLEAGEIEQAKQVGS